MSTSIDPSEEKNSYFTDPENPTEMARLTLQDHLTTQAMGGLFPEQTDLDFTQVHAILDVACGPGAWVLDVAYAYPKIEVAGIDISQIMIQYANARAGAQGLNNASFEVMNALQPLAFSDNTFDIVNARFLLSFMSPDTWPVFVKECLRITRPGGIVRLTEFEWGVTNGEANERLGEMIIRAYKMTGKSYSPDGRQLCITPMLGPLLRQGGCQDVRYKAHANEFSAGTPFNEGGYQNYMVAFQLFRPLLLKLGLATPDEYDRLCQQSLAEMLSDNFCGISYFLTVWGKKP